MTQPERDFLDKQIRGLSIRNGWGIFITALISCSTAISIYYGVKSEMELIRQEIKFINYRIDKLESANNRLEDRK